MRLIILLVVWFVTAPSAMAFQIQVSIGKAYLRPVSLTANKKPLVECLREICKQARVELEPDHTALLEMKLNLDEPRTITFTDIRLYDAIPRLVPAKDHPGVVHRLRRGKLVVTSATAYLKHQASLIPDWLPANRVNHINDEDRIQIVSIHDEDDDSVMNRLAELPGLTEIHLNHTQGLTLVGLESLANCKSLIKLSMNGIGRPANPDSKWTSDEALFAISKIATLEHLQANDCGISDAGLEHLASLKQLEFLSLRQNQIKGDGLKSLAGLKKLKSLDFGCHVSSAIYGKNEITDEHIKHIEGLQQLIYLGIEGLNVTAHKLNFPRLRSLTLGSAFKPKLLDNKALGNLLRYKDLRHLTVKSDTVTDAGIALISNLKTLGSLELHCRSVTDNGIATITGLPLTHLELRRVELTDEGLRHISTIKTLERISIFAGMDRTTVEGFQQFKSLPKLDTLWLHGFRGKHDYRGFGELKQLRSLFFEMADLANWTQLDLDQLGESLPNARVNLGTGGGTYGPKNQNGGGFGRTIPLRP